jgi:hypothetical protein
MKNFPDLAVATTQQTAKTAEGVDRIEGLRGVGLDVF